MIVTRFIMRVVDRIKNPPITTRDELHEEVLRRKQAYEEHRKRQANEECRRSYLDQLRARPMYASTPSGKTRGKDLEDAAALAIYSGLDFQARPEIAPESAMNAIGSCNGRLA